MRWSLFASLVLALTSSVSLAQSTAFTYQGRLTANGSAQTGLYDMRFTLYSDLTSGLPVAPTVCVNNVQVTDGVFSTTVDFGKAFVTNGTRAIELAVRPDTGLDCSNTGGFTSLAPRQVVAPVPIATWAHVASALAPADGSGGNAVTVDSTGRVGVGTSTPSATLHVAAPVPTFVLQDSDSTAQQVGYISYRDSTNTERAYIGFGSTGNPNFTISNARANGNLVLLTDATGSVGVGTPSPSAKLDVRGEVKFGAAGQYSPAASLEENLRMVRGTIAATGTVFAGSGWTVTRPSTGRFDVTFTTAFNGTPTYVATAGNTGRTVVVGNVTNNSCTFFTYDNTGGLFNTSVNFIAIGPR